MEATRQRILDFLHAGSPNKVEKIMNSINCYKGFVCKVMRMVWEGKSLNRKSEQVDIKMDIKDTMEVIIKVDMTKSMPSMAKGAPTCASPPCQTALSLTMLSGAWWTGRPVTPLTRTWTT